MTKQPQGGRKQNQGGGNLVTAFRMSVYETMPTRMSSSISASVTHTWVALWDSIWAMTAANELVCLHVNGALLPRYMLLSLPTGIWFT